jgi:hypothetical protein
MQTSKLALPLFEIGKYVCPKTKLQAPLMANCSFASIQWPHVVERCVECGGQHVLSSEEVLHVPVFGYE